MKQFPSHIIDILNKNINQLLKNIVTLKNPTINQLASCRTSQKFMKDSYMTKCMRTTIFP